jgi:hypothetical protein
MPYVEREPVVSDPDSGSATGFAAIKYTAIVIIVMALIAFMVWAIGRFT